MKLDFRPAQPEDIEPLFAFNRELIDAYEDKSLIDYGRVLAWVRRKLERHLSEYTCIWADGQKAGYFHFYPLDGKVMELDDLYLFPAFRGRGIGTEIIRACCRAAAGRPVVLYVFVRNTRAVALYRRLGFCVAAQPSTTRYIMRREADTP